MPSIYFLQAQDAELVQHAADRAGPLRHLLQRRLTHGDSQEVLRGGVQVRKRFESSTPFHLITSKDLNS